MSIWGKITGEFIDIVEWLDNSTHVMVHRFERYQNEIKMGARLTVREGQLAVMVNEGQLAKGQVADVFGPGMYTLNTENLPILATLKGWKYGFNSPFKAEVYFFNTTQFTSLKWGTAGPATLRDPELGAVRVTAFGIYSLRIHDPKTVLTELVGTKAEFTTDDIEENLRGKIGTRIKEVMPGIGVPVLQLESEVGTVGERIRTLIAADFERLGLALTEVQVQDIGLPEELERAIDQQGAMRLIGNLNQFGQYQAAQALRDAAQNPGASGTMMGVGVGGMLTGAMGTLFQPGSPGAAGSTGTSAAAHPQGAAMPPPLPAAILWYAAIEGKQAGPFDISALSELAARGAVVRDSLVWRQGLAGWAPAADQPELASLFAAMPPPLPPR